MVNMFEKYTADCESQQEEIEDTVVAAKESMVLSDAPQDEKRTTLSLSLTVSDKKALKMMAAEQETTVAAIIHGWIAEHLKEESKQ